MLSDLNDDLLFISAIKINPHDVTHGDIIMHSTVFHIVTYQAIRFQSSITSLI